MPGSVIISGAFNQAALSGGLAWCFLQFILGFKGLGWDVLFVDRQLPLQDIHEIPNESTPPRYLDRVIRKWKLDNNYVLLDNSGGSTIGPTRTRVLQRAAGADVLLNIMGYLCDEDIMSSVRRRVFLDIDPGFGQMWRELGWHDPFQGHDSFVTLGRNTGQPDCTIPTCGLNWITMPQPVVLDEWPAQPPIEDGAFTSIGAWRGPNAPVEYEGRTYGLRVHEFRKFIELPSHCPGTRFEMALDIHPGDHKDIRSLQDNGWSLVDPKAVAGDPAQYRSYIAQSKAELMIPKQIYVDTNSGLLSDRSVYYLATGRPVLARDTGIGKLYPTGAGLLTFTNMAEAVDGIKEINGNYRRHAAAARELAVDYFDSDKVLATLLEKLGVG